MKDAESSGNIEIKLEQAEDLKDELDDLIDKIKKEKDPLDKEYDTIRAELDKKNEHITGLKTVLTAEKNEKN
jgi:F0F1-type ATP synthase membrane subunit b/b'